MSLERPPPVSVPLATSDLTGRARHALEANLEATRGLLEPERLAEIVAVGELLADALRAGGKVLLFGNGGSAAEAQHLAGELLGRFGRDRAALPAIALADSAATMTAIANDYDYRDVFARQVSGLGRPGDVAVGLSTSGASENVLRGLRAAAEAGLHTVALTGLSGGAMGQEAERCLRVPVCGTARVQEAHLLVGHLLCEIVELELFGRTG